MTKAEVLMKIALEHLSDGHDAYCTDCGWCGFSDQIGCPYGNCPECESEATVTGAKEVAFHYLDEAMEVLDVQP